MSGRPILKSPFEIRSWRRLNGGGRLPIHGSRSPAQTVLEELRSQEGGVSSALLVSLVRQLSAEGAGPDVLKEVVSRSRSRDCLPSVEAAEALLSRGDTASAEELLSMSSRSQEILHRSVAEARIRLAKGDPAGAGESALRAYSADPSHQEVYPILMETDPSGGWAQRQNIQAILSGGDPPNPPGEGRVQDLYRIYYEWYRGSREAASDMLVGSSYYRDGDPEFLLASARMSVDEKDWHSACMVYGRIVRDTMPFVRVEAADAHIEAGDPVGALDLLSSADQSSPAVMRCIARARLALGDGAEAMDAIRSYLDSEWAGSDQLIGAVRLLLSRGMEAQASGLLASYMESNRGDPDALAMQSVLRMRAGDYPGARACASEAVRRDPDCLGARVQRARMLFLTDSVQRAEKECIRVLAIDPCNRDALLLRKDMMVSRGDFAGAAGICRSLLESDYSDTEAMLSLAEALSATGEDETVVDMCSRAVRVDGGRKVAVRAVSVLVASGLLRDAVLLCRDAESSFPGGPEIKRLRGNAEYGLGEYLKASASYAAAAKADPDNPVLWYSKGMADERRGDLDSAEEAYNRALLLDLGEPEYWISKASVQEAKGDASGAVESLNRAIELERGSVYALVRKAAIFAGMSRYVDALHYLELARAADPSNPGIIRERMGIQIAMGDPEGALESYDLLPPGVADEGAVLMRVRCLEGMGRMDAAVAAAEDGLRLLPDSDAIRGAREALSGTPGATVRGEAAGDESGIGGQAPGPVADAGQESPGSCPQPMGESEEAGRDSDVGTTSKEDAEALYSMAVSLLDAGDLKGAIRSADKALAADPGDPDCLRLKATAVLRSGDVDGAVFLVSSALRENPDDPGLHLVMGDARAAKGDLRGALQEYDLAISKGEDGADVYVSKGEALERMGAPDRASECYSAAVSRDPSRLDPAEKLARMMVSRRELLAADSMVSRILRRDPRRESAIILKAEIAQARGDEQGLMSAYTMFAGCPAPSPDGTLRMVRILEDSGHASESRALLGDRAEDADKSVKRYAEKVLRRAYSTKTPYTDRDLLNAVGMDPDTAARVRAYLSEVPDSGRIGPGDERFRTMEARSRDAVLKLRWEDLDRNPRLPLDRVFIQCGCRDVDEAREIVAYVMRCMLTDPEPDPDGDLGSMSMRYPRGTTVYEIMSMTDLGVYEARQVQSQIV